MNAYQIWAEGYTIIDDSYEATFLGEWKGHTFKDAITAYRNSLSDEYSRAFIDVQRLTFWGSKFFDNETDARKSFG